MGDRVDPARARPVPFCRHGLRPPPEMSPLVLVDAVPERRLASCIRTASCSSDRSPSRPKTAPATSSSPIFSWAAEYSGSLTGDGFSFRSGIVHLHIGAAARTGRVMDDEQSAVGARHRARHDDGVVVGKYLEHLEIEDRGGLIAHLPRHPHPFAHAPGIRAVADRSAVAEILVGAVGAGKAGEMVALDDAGVAVALGDAGYVDLIADLEHVGSRNRLSELQLGLAAAFELARFDSGRDVGLGEMAALAAGDAAELFFAEGNLHGFIAVSRRGLQLGDGAWTERQHGGSAHAAGGVGHLGHPYFFSNQSGQHRPYSSLISTSTPAARSSLPSASMVCWVGSRTSSRRL